jgi:hypothetical protein
MLLGIFVPFAFDKDPISLKTVLLEFILEGSMFSLKMLVHKLIPDPLGLLG